MTSLLIAIAAALAASICAGMLGRRMPAWWQRVAEGRRVASRADQLPSIFRLLITLAEPVAAWLGPRLPTGSRESVQRRLRRAGIDEEILPQQWLALCGVSLFGAVAVVGGVGGSVAWALVGAIAGAGLPMLWMRDVIARRTQEVVRDLPVYVDMLTLALEAGGALSVATERAPDGVLRRAFLRVQGDLRAGRSRGEALQALAERLAVPAVDPLVAALVQAESSGASLASMLRAQADQRLHERFARAEKLALEAPVKMLGPLVLCIFPCTFLVLAFPLVMRVLEGP
jgi:tight adherence protein C